MKLLVYGNLLIWENAMQKYYTKTICKDSAHQIIYRFLYSEWALPNLCIGHIKTTGLHDIRYTTFFRVNVTPQPRFRESRKRTKIVKTYLILGNKSGNKRLCLSVPGDKSK
jgi:hypothetical protein